MSAKNDAIKPQVRYHGAQVPRLVVRSVRVTFGLVRPPPAEEVEDYHPPARKMRHQPVVEVQIVREAVHQHDRRFLTRILPRVDPVASSRHRVFPVPHHLLLSSDHRYSSLMFCLCFAIQTLSGSRPSADPLPLVLNQPALSAYTPFFYAAAPTE